MKPGDFATGAALAFGVAVGVFVLWIFLRQAPIPSESCWRDPRASTILDFDFHTFVDGAPIRCGYMPPRANSVLPRVVGEMDRGVFSDILCYPLEKIKCP
jgi:hypothetical protein